MTKNVALVWSGWREHAIASKLLSEGVTVYALPWNPWIEKEWAILVEFEDGLEWLVASIKKVAIDLVVIWPEKYLCDGIVNILKSNGIKVLWPEQAASFLEWDKENAKIFMQQYDIPTAGSQTFFNQKDAEDFFSTIEYPKVLKQSGLASGKWVKICYNLEEASLFTSAYFSDTWIPHKKLIVEDYLVWREVSAFAFIDTIGETFKIFTTATDHKAESDGWKWDMTWWMGTFSPAVINEKLQKNIETMFQNVLRWLKDSWLQYTWPLFAGLMVDENDDFNVLEFNARFWDPETQSILLRMETSLYDLMLKNAEGTLHTVDEIRFSSQKAVTVVLADPWYPKVWTHKETLITWLDELPEDVKVFHMGTKKWENGDILVNGWRVLSLTALAGTYREAKEKVYHALQMIRFWGDIPKYRTEWGNANYKLR